MKRYSDAFTQGGQTQLHTFHMIQQVVTTTLKIDLILSLVFFISIICLNYSFEQIYFLIVFNKASFRLHFDFLPKGFFDTSWVLSNSNQWTEINDYILANHKEYINYAAQLTVEMIKKVMQTIYFFCFSFVLLSIYWVSRGKERQETKILKGYELVEPKILRKLVIKRGASELNVAGVPLPKNAECEHMMITGTTGAGKTNAINSLLLQIKKLNHKAIIIDTSGGFVSRFYEDKKDLLLNPFDKRTQHWNLWNECNEEYDFDEFSESLINMDSYDKFWTRAAQQLFSTAALKMKKGNKASIQELLNSLLSKPLNEIFPHFEDTLVSAYVDPATEKTAMGIRATLVSALRNLKYLEDKDNNFSIRNWLKTEDKNWLFISSLPIQRETLKPLMTAWLSIAVKSIMSMGEDLNRRVWIIIDELASLNKVPILMQGLSEIRRYGGCFILSFQDLYQLDAIYGSQVAHTFGSLTGTKIVFRMDSHGAKQMASLFGEQEILEPNESISFGAHQMREGVSLTDHQKVRSLISPSDLMKLDNLEAFLKFPRNLPASKIKFPFS